MAWQDRLKQAAYVSPDGTRFPFLYENVSRTFDRKTSGFEFPDADGTYVQDTGTSSRKYPLRIFLSGDDYDIEATNFEEALAQRGVGRLEHPLYGTIDVVPFGTISRKDNLKTAANQAVIELVFWETIGLIYPSEQADPSSSVLQSIDEFNEAISEEFSETIDLDSAVQRATLKDSYAALKNQMTSTLQRIADAQDSVRIRFNSINDSIDQGIDILIADPLTLGFQTTLLLQTPSRSLVEITARLDAYVSLTQSVISGDGAVSEPTLDSEATNQFRTRDLYASTYLTGVVVSSINNQFMTKNEALSAADLLLDQFNQVTAWRDANFEALGEVDTGGSYQKLQASVATAAGFLVDISFTLKQERRFILQEPHTIIDLCAQLYGSVDDKLDFFINSNNFTGSEIIELPAGREIVYYV